MNLIAISVLTTMFATIGFSLLLFSYLLRLNLKLKNELPKELREEIDKNRDIYNFVKNREFVNPEILVVNFEQIHPKSPEYPISLERCTKELKERSIGKNKTLTKSGNFYELSENVKKFFMYENPTLSQLLSLIFMKK
jgi:hypothetical protein